MEKSLGAIFDKIPFTIVQGIWSDSGAVYIYSAYSWMKSDRRYKVNMLKATKTLCPGYMPQPKIQ